MAINGAHAMLYTSEPEALRAVMRDVLGWKYVDDGQDEGWLIFALPPAEIGVHPGDAAKHELSFMCDDLDATVADLRAKGIEFKGDAVDEGWGIAIPMVLPGGVELLLYQPRHASPVSRG